MTNNLFIKMTYLPDSQLDEDRTTYSNKHKQVENKDVHIHFFLYFRCLQMCPGVRMHRSGVCFYNHDRDVIIRCVRTIPRSISGRVRGDRLLCYG